MPVNVLRKDIPKGEKPPGWSTPAQMNEEGQNSDERERDLAVQEQEALWESEETGIVRWSGEHGQRYSD